MARKGWDQLSANYRQRLQRSGVSRGSYESGGSLKKARGHATPTDMGEKRYRALIKLANALPWTNTTGREVVDTELTRGTDPEWLRARLEEKEKAQSAYQQWLRDNGFRNWFDAKKAGKEYNGPGKREWKRRRLSVGVELFWYH